MSNRFHFQSKSTKYYVKSTKDDKDGHDITTVDGGSSVPPDTVRSPHRQISLPASFSSSKAHCFFWQILSLNPGEIPGTVYIVGAAGLYVSLGVSLHLCIHLEDIFLT